MGKAGTQSKAEMASNGIAVSFGGGAPLTLPPAVSPNADQVAPQRGLAGVSCRAAIGRTDSQSSSR